MADRQALPGPNQGVAVQTAGTPIGPVTQEERREGALMAIDQITLPVACINFGAGLKVTPSPDGRTVTVELDV